MDISSQQQNIQKIPHLIIASCKGGVGKSTITSAIAQTIQKRYSIPVGVIDADIWGSSQHILFNCEDESLANNRTPLITKSGVELFSMGLMSKNAIIWRAPLVLKFVKHMLYNVQWAHAKLILVDTPPGTSDILISLAKELATVAKAVIVTTPQDMNNKISARSETMFNKFNLPVVHHIINMAYMSCEKCGHKNYSINSNPDNSTVLPFDNRIWKNQNIIENIGEHLDHAIEKIFQQNATQMI